MLLTVLILLLTPESAKELLMGLMHVLLKLLLRLLRGLSQNCSDC